MSFLKIPKYLKPKVEIFGPPTFNYQRTDADTRFHYKFLQDDWLTWIPIINPGLSFDVIWDYASYGGYHLLKDYSDHGYMNFQQPVPDNLTQGISLDFLGPLSTTSISMQTNPSLPPYDGADTLVVGASDSFVVSITVMIEREPLQDNRRTPILVWINGTGTWGGTCVFYLFHFWENGRIYGSLIDFVNGYELLVEFPNVDQFLRLDRWNQITTVWDRNSTSKPDLWINTVKIPGRSPDWEDVDPSTVALFSDFGELIFDERIAFNAGGAFGDEAPMRWAEAWMSLGTSFTRRTGN